MFYPFLEIKEAPTLLFKQPSRMGVNEAYQSTVLNKQKLPFCDAIILHAVQHMHMAHILGW